MKKLVIALSFFVLLFVFQEVSAHTGLRLSDKEYQVSVEVNGVEIDADTNPLFPNDQNIFSEADVLFDYEVDPTDPDHDAETGLSNVPVEIGSGESVTFDTPLEIYSHTMCSCENTIDTRIDAVDYAPIKSTAWSLFKKGVSLTGTYLLEGPVGVGVDVLGELIGFVGEQIWASTLTDEEKAAYAEAQVRSNSEFIGRLDETNTTTCDQTEFQYTGELTNEEQPVGDITYTIKQIETGNECPVPIAETPPGNTGEEDEGGGDESGDGDDEDKPLCMPETGKVFVAGDYHCPTSSVPAGAGCKCLKGYEWADLGNLCDGCTKTRVDRCLEAVDAAIDDATGIFEPVLEVVEETKIHWNVEKPLARIRPQ